MRSNLLNGQFQIGPICYLTFNRNYLILGLIACMVNFLWTKLWTIYPIWRVNVVAYSDTLGIQEKCNCNRLSLKPHFVSSSFCGIQVSSQAEYHLKRPSYADSADTSQVRARYYLALVYDRLSAGLADVFRPKYFGIIQSSQGLSVSVSVVHYLAHPIPNQTKTKNQFFLFKSWLKSVTVTSQNLLVMVWE